MRPLINFYTTLFIVSGFIFVNMNETIAQLQVNGADKPPYDPVNLIHNVFLGSGVTVLDVKYEGEPHALGYFDHAVDQLGINRGIIMSTGRAEFAQRPNVESNFSSFSSDLKFSDPDLIKALGLDPGTPEIVRDLARYEITFIPHADSLRFNYVFASEEYPKYACSQFKDVFGFFISGPDPKGGQYSAKNIALVPGTGEVVSISTVNDGEPSIFNCLPKNDHLYNDNTGSLSLTYNAYLDVFTAAVKVVPCETYVIKLAISDIADDLYDSAVFLEAKSFTTNEVAVNISTFSSDGNIAEGCQPAQISFAFADVVQETYDLDIKILPFHPNLKVATDLVDYSGIPPKLSIQPGQKETSVLIQPIPDQLEEGIEWVIIEYRKNICQRDTLFIGILDDRMPQIYTKDSFLICKGDTIQLEASLEQGYTPPPPLVFRNDGHFAITPVGEPVFSPVLVQGVGHKYLGDQVIDKVCIDTAWIVGLHNFDFYLISPKGRVLELSTANGKRSGGGNIIDSLVKTCFTPQATNNINRGNPVQSTIDLSNPSYTGNYAPEGSWSNLWPDDQEEVNGLWQLKVVDNHSFIGHLEAWSISFNPNYQISYKWLPDDSSMDCPVCHNTAAFPVQTTLYMVEAMDSYGCTSVDSSFAEVIRIPEVTGFGCDSVATDFLRYRWDEIPQSYILEYSTDGSNWSIASGTQLVFSNLGFSQKVPLYVRLFDGICHGTIQRAECETLPCPAPDITTVSIQEPDCYGDNDAAILFQAQGTVGPYLFELNSQNNLTGIFTGLSGGTDTLYVTDGKNCRVPFIFNIHQPEPLTLNPQIDSIDCFGRKNGAILVQATGGNGNFIYHWTGEINVSGSADHFENLGPGFYHIRVEDARSCYTEVSVNLVNPPKLNLTANTTDVLCKPLSTGAIQLFCSGGYGNFTYHWSANGFSSMEPSLQYLSGGRYFLTVTDAGDCSIDTSFLIREPAEELIVQITGMDTLCYAGSTGSLLATISGGTAPYSILWQNGSVTPGIYNIQPGIYSVLVTDRNGCKTSERKEVVKLPALSVDYQLIQPDCAGRPNGRIIINSAGYGLVDAKLDELTYEWNTLPKQQTKDAWFLIGNETYQLKVSDKYGCSYLFNIFLPDVQPITLETVSIDEVSCFGKSDGAVEITVAGGKAPYRYYWSANTTNAADTIAENLAVGYYWLTISDAVFCTNSFNIYIPGPTAIVSSAVIEHIDCYGETTGSIDITVTGGAEPYSFWWNGQPGDAEISELPADTVQLEIRDRNGCSIQESFVLEQPLSPLSMTAESVDVSCLFGSDGSVAMNAFGGTKPYSYSLDGKKWQTGQAFYGLPAGIYSGFTRDGNDCEYMLEGITISEGSQLMASLGPDTSIIFGSRLKLHPVVTGHIVDQLAYKWTCSDMSILSCNDCEQPVVSPNTNSIVFLEVTNGLGCIAESNIKISVILDKNIRVPDVFTPNHDKVNDLLQVFGSPGSVVRKFLIRDNWGKLVFELHDFPVNQENTGWDGTFAGQECSPGIYNWFVEARHTDLSLTTHEGRSLLVK